MVNVLVNFNIKQEFRDTLEEFHKRASKRPHLRPELIQRTMVALSNDEYCREVLQFYDRDSDNLNANTNSNTSTTEIGEPQPNKDNDTISEEQEEAYASSVSDPDYTHEGLVPLTVSQAIRKNPGSIRVTGIIDTVRPPFKLLTKVYFMCTNLRCRRRDIGQPYILDRPIFPMADMPIAFAGGVDDYNRYL